MLQYYVENVSCGIFPVFERGECVRVTGLSENLGTRLKCVFLSKILYIYFEINVFKAQMGYGGTQKMQNKNYF